MLLAIGNILREARTRRGLTIAQVAQDTRISARFLEALEAETFAVLPAPVYVRGFIRSYANYLRVEPGPLLAELPSLVPGDVGPDLFVPGPATGRGPGPVNDPFQATRGRAAAAPGPVRGNLRRPTASEAPYDGAPHGDNIYARGRGSGVLVEREIPDDAGPRARVAAFAVAGVVALLFVAVVGSLLASSGDDGPPGAAPGGQSPAASGGRTVVPVGSPTATRTVMPAVTGTTTPGTPGATATTAPGDTNPAPTTAPGTPTSAPSTATSTPAPPTATRPPPTPTPVPTIAPHASGFGECRLVQPGVYDCGEKPWSVVCAPNGWFVDVDADSPHGWPRRPANSNSEVFDLGAACTNGTF